MSETNRRLAGLVARGAVAVARGVVRALPAGVKRRLEERLFHAVGHATRVTNDGYPQPVELARPPGRGPATGDGPADVRSSERSPRG